MLGTKIGTSVVCSLDILQTPVRRLATHPVPVWAQHRRNQKKKKRYWHRKNLWLHRNIAMTPRAYILFKQMNCMQMQFLIPGKILLWKCSWLSAASLVIHPKRKTEVSKILQFGSVYNGQWAVRAWVTPLRRRAGGTTADTPHGTLQNPPEGAHLWPCSSGRKHHYLLLKWFISFFFL